MLLSIDIAEKQIGAKELFRDLKLVINPKEKLAIIGRNGVGKTTLFNLLTGKDKGYEGSIQQKRGTRIVATNQEFDTVGNPNTLEYITSNLPEYADLKDVLDSFAKHQHTDTASITKYSDALERFTDLGYFDVESRIQKSLSAYQITPTMINGKFAKLSGGQKRFVELVRVELSEADVALVDEPTNHMDSVAKQNFIAWLKKYAGAVVVITHDRDVLEAVDRIVEIKDQRIYSFPGNYSNYLIQNSVTTIGEITQYEVAQRTIDNLKKQIAIARAKKPSWGGTADKKNPFVVIEERLTKQLKELEATVGKPSFWIDKESVGELHKDVVTKYERYKARNIKIHKSELNERASFLVEVAELRLGYQEPLFKELNLSMGGGDRLQLLGRNGVGKSTFLKTLIATAKEQPPQAKIFNGEIKLSPKLRIGIYEQEPEPHWLPQKLIDTIMGFYHELDLPIDEQKAKQIMADYLFDPRADSGLTVERLSGGQKARLQIIRMLAGSPNLLILDEPTNHLDLPSIEELEQALLKYTGAILYVSHDSYFAKQLGGEQLELEKFLES